MLRKVLVVAALAAPALGYAPSSGVLGLRAQSEMSRRDVCTAFGSALGLGVAAVVAPQGAHAEKARSGLSSPFTGDYADPNHPGCARSVKIEGAPMKPDGTRSRNKVAIVKGQDNPKGGACNGEPDLVSWKLEGKVAETGDKILVDFTPKGGPKDLTGTWDKDGIVFPDGNKWAKKVPQ
mmetsp:Transcript_23215/g.46594  ORF Transcript_23215/g.46594 Transcript_23215/m.46594 type:complete len:179 (+) Transcript_23215:33-569(+)